MTIELPSLVNVVRFPIEQRIAPSMELIFEIQPDWREVERVEAFQLALPPHDLPQQVDAQTASIIAQSILPLAPAKRTLALDALLRPAVARALAACRQADGVGQQAAQVHERLLAARTRGGSWLDLLEEQADALTRQAAELLIVAHQRCQEARGVARGGLRPARRGVGALPRAGGDADVAGGRAAPSRARLPRSADGTGPRHRAARVSTRARLMP